MSTVVDVAFDPAAAAALVAQSRSAAVRLAVLGHEVRMPRGLPVGWAVAAPPAIGFDLLEELQRQLLGNASEVQLLIEAVLAADVWPGLNGAFSPWFGGGVPAWTMADAEQIVALDEERARLLALIATGDARDARRAQSQLASVEAEIAALASTFDRRGWQAVADRQAGFDRSTWDPSKGLAHNDANIRAIYDYYGDLYLADNDLQWAGMASLAGRLLYAGWIDLAVARRMLTPGGRIEHGLDMMGLPGPGPLGPLADVASLANPAGIADRATLGSLDDDARWVETTMLTMAESVFDDLGWMHAAYSIGGVAVVTAVLRSDTGSNRKNEKTIAAWEGIDSGQQDRIEHATETLLHREQHDVVQGGWDELASRPPRRGTQLVPGLHQRKPGSPRRQFSQRWCATRRPSRSRLRQHHRWAPATTRTGGTATCEVFSTPGDVRQFDDRWAWISESMLPAYFEMVRHRPEELEAILATPISPDDPTVRGHRTMPNLLHYD